MLPFGFEKLRFEPFFFQDTLDTSFGHFLFFAISLDFPKIFQSHHSAEDFFQYPSNKSKDAPWAATVIG
jgi:hypothetical protein